MSDERKILEESLGMPMAWVFDVNENPIIVQDEFGDDLNINYLITSFKYKYDEENDDECNIKIRVSKIEQLNNKALSIDSRLKVQWGYVTPNGDILKSPKRLISIRDMEKDYKSDGVELELICTDTVAYIRKMRAIMRTDHDNFGAWIKELIEGKYKATITRKGIMKPIVNDNASTIVPKLGKIRIEDETNRLPVDSLDPNNVYDPHKVLTINNGIAGWEKTPDKTIKGESKSVSQQISDMLATEPGGPYHTNTRDDSINIIVRHFDQVPFAKYTYAGGNGELISFKPKSSVVKSDLDETIMNNVNPETKEVETMRMIKAVDTSKLPPGVTKLDIIRAFDIMKAMWGIAWQSPLNQPEIRDIVKIHRRVKKGGHANQENVMGSTRVRIANMDYDYDTDVDLKLILQSPIFDALKKQAFLENFSQKKVERKYEAEAKILGDPSLVCSKVYRIENVSSFDSGNWYAASVSHELDVNNGYITVLELLKKPTILGKLIEKRKNKFNSDSSTPPEYIEDVALLEDKDISSGYSGNVPDIESRLATNYENERLYNSMQDVDMDEKKNVSTYSNKTNASDT